MIYKAPKSQKESGRITLSLFTDVRPVNNKNNVSELVSCFFLLTDSLIKPIKALVISGLHCGIQSDMFPTSLHRCKTLDLIIPQFHQQQKHSSFKSKLNSLMDFKY